MAIRTLLLAALLAAPLAAAGGLDASLDYLHTAETGCASSSYEEYDSGDGWSEGRAEHAETCADDFRYAALTVRDDDGEVASASAGTRHGSSDNDSFAYGSQYGAWNDSRWYSSSARGAFHNETHDRREVALSTREGSLSASDGCASRHADAYEYHGNAYSGSGPGYSSDSRWDSSSGGHDVATRCGSDVTATREGTELSASPWSSSCRSESASTWSRQSGTYSYTDPDGNETSSSYESRSTGHESRDACFQGASAGVDEHRASAGHEYACEESGESYGGASGNDTYGHARGERACSGGFVVRGPDGLVLFAGSGERTWHSCHESSEGGFCHDGAEQWSHTSLTWAHNPLGPGTVYLPFVPLA